MAGETGDGGLRSDLGQPAPSYAPSTASWPQMSAPSGAQISAAGSGAEAVGALVQGIVAHQRAQRIAAYNAEVAEANATAQAQAAELEALQATRQATMTRQDEQLAQEAQAWRAARQREEQGRLLGQTRAIIGASGLLMEGSPMAVYEETVRQYGLSTAAQQYQTRLQQRALEDQATQQDYAAQLSRYGAGERLRVGGQQAGLIRANADDSQIAAGLLKAGSAITTGAARYEAQQERLRAARNPGLLGGG